MGLKYSTAKCIYKLFTEESRLGTTRISKEGLLSSYSNKKDESTRESEERDKDIEYRKSRTAGIKWLKKSPEESTAVKRSIEEKYGTINQDDSLSLDTQTKGCSDPDFEIKHSNCFTTNKFSLNLLHQLQRKLLHRYFKGTKTLLNQRC